MPIDEILYFTERGLQCYIGISIRNCCFIVDYHGLFFNSLMINIVFESTTALFFLQFFSFHW